MTNAELIQAIKAEINYRIETYIGNAQSCVGTTIVDGLEEVLDFISTLESENPMQEGLEKEIENAWENLEKDYSPSALDETKILVSGLVGEKQFSKIAEHFAEWGAEHAKIDATEMLGEDEKPVPADLEEVANGYEKKHTYQRYDGGGLTPEYDATLAEAFIDGVKWQNEQDDYDTIFYKGMMYYRKQMLEEAVEGEVDKFGEVAYVKERNNAELTKYLSRFNNGDKVKIIVIHETDIR